MSEYSYIVGLFVGWALGIALGISIGMYIANKKIWKNLIKKEVAGK